MQRRPEVSQETIREAAEIVAQQLGNPAGDYHIAEKYAYGMDGFELAKDLDRYCGWNISAANVETLDGMEGEVDTIHKKVCEQWVIDNDIQPPLPVGAEIKEGVIAGIYEHDPATYQVKLHGCTEEGRHRLIKFEDAVATRSFKKGDKVNYHSIIGGPVTSTGHEIKTIQLEPNNFSSDVAWVTGKSGCVALEALSFADEL